MADKVFRGTVVLPDRIIDDGYVLVGDGLVQSVGSGAAPAGEKHGGADFLVLPGAIDAQVHSRSQLGQEDFVWSTRSAAAGGVTTIVDMPYDDNCLIATAQRFRTKVSEAGAQARVDFALYATIDPDEGASRVDELVDAGAAAFKFSTFGTHPKRFPRIPPQTLYACFRAVGRRGLIAGIHNENDEMVRAFMAEVEARGITDYTAHGLSRPPITEALATAEVYRTRRRRRLPGAYRSQLDRPRLRAWRRPIARRDTVQRSRPAFTILRSTKRMTCAGSAARPRSIRRSGRGARSKHCGITLPRAMSRSSRPIT